MIIGEVKKSGGDAIASITGSGFDPEFPHGTVFDVVEVHTGPVSVVIRGDLVQYQHGNDIPYLTTSMSVRQSDGKYDHAIPLLRFFRRTKVHVVNIPKTDKEKKDFLKENCPVAEVANVEKFDNVPAPWLPGQGIFQIIRADATGKYASLAGYPGSYTTGELSKNYDQRLTAFLKGKKLISDHHTPAKGAWIVYKPWEESKRQYPVYSNGLQYFRLVPTMKDKIDNTPAWQALVGNNAALWGELFEEGLQWESARNAEFVRLYGEF